MNNSFLKQGSIIFIGNAINRLVLFVSSIILVRLISVELFGTYRQIWLVYNIMSAVFISGFASSIYYFLPKYEKENNRSLILQTMLFVFFFGILIALGMFFARDKIGQVFNNDDIGNYLEVFFLYPLFGMVSIIIYPYLISKGREVLAVIFTSASKLLQLAAVTVPLLLGYSLEIAFKMLVLSAFLEVFIGISIVLYDSRKQVAEFNLPRIREQIKFVLPLGLSSTIGILQKQLDKVIISIFYDPGRYAIYAIGAVEVPFIGVVTSAIYTATVAVFGRYFSENKHEDIIALTRKILKVTSILLFPVFFYLMVFAPYVIESVFSSKYLESTLLFRIYLPVILLRLFPWTAFFIAAGNTRIVFRGAIIAFIANILLSITFINAFGFWGPAAATVIAMLIEIIYYLKNINNTIRISIRGIFPIKHFLKGMLVCIIATCISSAALLFEMKGIKLVLISSFIFFIIYTFLVLKTGLVKKDDLELFVRRLVKKDD